MKHLAKRTLTFVLVLAMLISTIAVTAVADDILIAPNPNADPNKHVLDAGELELFGEGTHKDGETAASADGYFTLLWSEKTKVEAKEKTFEDGYKSTVRVNFSNGANTAKDAIKFTTTGAASVKIWWAAGDAGRQMTILDKSGKDVATTDGETAKDALYISTLELEKAGTYYLGGSPKKNYIFRVEVTETAGETVNVLDAADLETFEAGKYADGDAQAVGDYFTVIWSAKAAVNENSKTFADDFVGTKRINFGGTSNLGKSVIKFAVSGPAAVKVWWVCGGDGRNVDIFDAAGEVAYTSDVESVKDELYISEIAVEEAGTYYLGGSTGNNYLFKVQVTEVGGPKEPRADWDKVAAPVITSAKANGSKVDVTVAAEIGYDGADQVTVIMRDGDGWELKRLSSLAEKGEHVLSFEPSESGTYTFSVIATRDKESAVHSGSKTAEVKFTYPLGVPVMKYVANDGKNNLIVEWNPVKEATGYIVTAGDKSVSTEGVNSTKATVEGLSVGDKVSVTVKAVRDSEQGKDCDPMEATVSDTAEVAWVFSAFGTSTDTKNNGYEIKGENSVRVYSLNGKGKVQPSVEDGLALYYTAIDPSTTNFVLTATANVNTWTYNNGQEGFGLIVMDQVGVNGSTAPVWSNSYMAGVSGLSGVGVNMKLGVGSLARTGVTEFSSTKPDSYASAWTLLDFSGINTDIRNLVGNCTNIEGVPGKTIEPALTSFKLKLEKNDTGYYVSYTDHNGDTHTAEYPDPTALSYVDPYIYVGMFAARRMDVTFTDISFTTSPASGSSVPGGDGKEKTVEPSYSFASPADSNSGEFNLDFRSNADGRVVISTGYGKELYKGTVEAGKSVSVPVELDKGENNFIAVITPDADFTVDGAKLTSYEAATVASTVTYLTYSRTTIYVAPNGKAGAKGTADDPTTLAAAVAHPTPGTTIILMAGTYNYTTGVTVNRGINGTAGRPITIKADPNAATRPVLDWGEKGNGLRINGDWWYLYGFDSTRSTAKGVHIGGNHNTVERVNVYDNLNTGLSISRINFGDSIPDWPSYNTILNCSAWLNADSGYEDADGFEAKLTVGVGNVFDGCIAAYNADDGWDLFARGAAIGPVTIKNSIAFKNGYDIVNGKEVNAGNGNGFKLGGGNYPVDHKIVNSMAFANKANGFTCNSNPNLKIENCTAYDNGKGNLALYTNIAELDTDFGVKGFISYMGGGDDSIDAQGNQDKSAYLTDDSYYQGHISGESVSDTWFKSLDTDTAIKSGITRNDDGTISMNGYLQLTDKAPKSSGAKLPGAQGQNFRDIVKGSWYYDAVLKITKLNLTTGVTDSEFNPGGILSRAEMVTVLWNMNGRGVVNYLMTYGDVSEEDWYAEAIRWATSEGVVGGYDNGNFGPNDKITREQMAKMLYDYAKSNGVDVTVTGATTFKDDAAIDTWAREAMTWAIASGVIQGDGSGYANPTKTASRGEMAVVVARFVELLGK